MPKRARAPQSGRTIYRDDVAIKRVIELREKHINTWRNRRQWYWSLFLLEEIAELLLSLVGIHDDDPSWELTQIAAICVNWIEMREENET